MAMKEVTLDPSEQGDGTQFLKFDAIGTKFRGLYKGTRAATGTYAKQGEVEYLFKNKEGLHSHKPGADLKKKLEKAIASGDLKLDYECSIEFTHTRPMVTKDGSPMLDAQGNPKSPQKILKFMCGPYTPGVAAPAAARPPVPADDDVPF